MATAQAAATKARSSGKGKGKGGKGKANRAPKTTAKRVGGDWVINGGKMWTTNGTQADWMCLLANTGEGPVHKNKSLIVVQAALSLLLLVGAGLLTKSLNNLQHQDFGRQTENRYVVHIDPAGAGYSIEKLPALEQALEQRHDLAARTLATQRIVDACAQAVELALQPLPRAARVISAARVSWEARMVSTGRPGWSSRRPGPRGHARRPGFGACFQPTAQGPRPGQRSAGRPRR